RVMHYGPGVDQLQLRRAAIYEHPAIPVPGVAGSVMTMSVPMAAGTVRPLSAAVRVIGEAPPACPSAEGRQPARQANRRNRFRSGRCRFLTSDQQPGERNTGSKDDNVANLAEEDLSQDDLAQDQSCAEGETERRPTKWTCRERERHHGKRTADEEREQTWDERHEDLGRLERLEEGDCGFLVGAVPDE